MTFGVVRRTTPLFARTLEAVWKLFSAMGNETGRFGGEDGSESRDSEILRPLFPIPIVQIRQIRQIRRLSVKAAHTWGAAARVN
jgi:hypothetical protein